jgi:hypothetical protein
LSQSKIEKECDDSTQQKFQKAASETVFFMAASLAEV